MIPAGCTGLVQPLDVSVNKPFKNILRDLLEDLLDNHEATHQQNLRELHRSGISAIAERRILVTKAAGQAWEQFSLNHQELVVTTFRKLGLTLPIDSFYDSELSIKGIDCSLLGIGDGSQNGENRGKSELGNGREVEGGNGREPEGGNGREPERGNGQELERGNGQEPQRGNGHEPHRGNSREPQGELAISHLRLAVDEEDSSIVEFIDRD